MGLACVFDFDFGLFFQRNTHQIKHNKENKKTKKENKQRKKEQKKKKN